MNGPTARDDVLHRIDIALGDREGMPDPVPRDYRGADHGDGAVEGRSPKPGSPEAQLLAERIGEYQAAVRRCEPSQVPGEIAAALRARDVRRLVVPAGIYPPWLYEIPDGVDVIGDDPPLTPQQLDEADAVLTGCAVAIAETGTVVLDAGPGQGRRVLTLVPDYHLVVVPANRIVPSVPAAVAMLDASRPLTWISGPSATSDIELDRVEGVHGPRSLEVVVAGW